MEDVESFRVVFSLKHVAFSFAEPDVVCEAKKVKVCDRSA